MRFVLNIYTQKFFPPPETRFGRKSFWLFYDTLLLEVQNILFIFFSDTYIFDQIIQSNLLYMGGERERARGGGGEGVRKGSKEYVRRKEGEGRKRGK